MKIPKYIETLLTYTTLTLRVGGHRVEQRKKCMTWNADSQLSYGEFGLVFHIRPYNTYAYRDTFLKEVERFVAWAVRQGAQARIIRVHQPGKYQMNRDYDYVIVEMTDPALLYLEKAGMLDGPANPEYPMSNKAYYALKGAK